ncbi:hypothetical protein MNBD_GAMMA12-3681 [hydrothermal vent metagenome]|uniref:Lipoprotein n=1 Tax=hydrothermal vent metagenome TaxID=652676 RepID=A0A3B0Z859_9ZZZZ
MKQNSHYFLLGITSLILLSSCSPGRSIVFTFPNIYDRSKTTHCDTRLNGDWKLTQLANAQQAGKLPIDLKNLLFVRFKINKNCRSNTITVAFQEKNEQIPTVAVSQILRFPAYNNGQYFSFNFIRDTNKKTKSKRYMLFKYRHFKQNRVQIAMPSTEFIDKAIEQKLIAGKFLKSSHGGPHTRPAYTIPKITASKIELKKFIEQYSHSIFSLKMILTRIPKTQWRSRLLKLH